MRTDNKTIFERALHAILYEIIAISICAPITSWIMSTSIISMSILGLAISIAAIVWNMAFNKIYDQAIARFRINKTASIRLIHGILFEGGLTVIVVPLSAWWLHISLWEAFLLDVGLTAFYLPYTIAFNWVYDFFRASGRNAEEPMK